MILRRHLFSPVVIIVASALVLIGLIVLLTLVASNTITETVSETFRSQERQLVGTLARQMEFFFDTVAGDLLNLASRPEVRSITYVQREEALALFAEEATRHAGMIRSIIRFSDNGAPRYAWPPETNERVRNHLRLEWSLSAAAARDLIAAQAVSFRPVPVAAQRLAFILTAPVEATSSRTELLAFELELESWFAENFGPLDLGRTGQLWVIDQHGRLLYEGDGPVSWAETDELSVPFLLSRQGAEVQNYTAEDGQRQAAYAPARSHSAAFVIVLSRTVAESQSGVQRQLSVLAAMTILVVALVAGLAWMVGQRLWQESRRRQEEEQRRQVARTLLEVGRAINSSLDLDEVLDRILGELGNLLAHDSASIMLRVEDGLSVEAFRGDPEDHQLERVFSLDEAMAAGRVVESGESLMIPDCLTDPGWYPMPTPIRSWLGVPLRMRDETVGVLNINSHAPNGFRQADLEVALAFADQAGVAISNARLHEFRIQQYRTELQDAQEIQASLMPQEPLRIPQLEVVGFSLPASIVSGDFYQFLPRLDGKVGVAVGDVTGSGMPAALLMAVITTALRRELDRQPGAADLVRDLNESLFLRLKARHMTSALVMAVFDPDTRRVEVSNAGMVQPYLRTDRGEWLAIPVGGYPLGAAASVSYVAKTVTLAPGAMLVFVSDGVVEARSPDGELFGFERLEEFLADMPRDLESLEIIARILEAVHRHLGEQEAQDDITVVVMRSLEVPTITLEQLRQSEEETVPARSGDGRSVAAVAAPAGQEAADPTIEAPEEEAVSASS